MVSPEIIKLRLVSSPSEEVFSVRALPMTPQIRQLSHSLRVPQSLPAVRGKMQPMALPQSWPSTSASLLAKIFSKT